MSARADGATTPVPVHDPNAFIEGTMDEFMAQPVIFSEGVWVTRREVIKYIANVKDGAHSGGGKAGLDHVKAPLEYARRRARIKAASGGFNVKMVEPTGAVFDPTNFPYDAAAVDVVPLELLAAVHLTVRSPAVRALEEYIRNWAAKAWHRVRSFWACDRRRRHMELPQWNTRSIPTTDNYWGRPATQRRDQQRLFPDRASSIFGCKTFGPRRCSAFQ
jgi:hypothetical protein